MTVMSKYYCFAVLTILLAGCGGSENDASTGTMTGVFLDGPATGVKYVFGRYSGLTGAGGTFACQPDQIGRFKIGNVILGQAVCASVITPVDLVKHSKPHLSTAQAQISALPIVQFLMSVGSVASDGSIVIPESVSALAASQSANLLTADPTTLQSIARTITGNSSLAYMDATAASNHLTRSLSDINQAKHAGEYVSSSWHNDTVAHFLVKPSGELSGYLLVMYGYLYEMTGSISSSGTLSLSIKDPVTKQAKTSSTSTGMSSGIGMITGTTHASVNEMFQYVLQRVTPATHNYYGVFRGSLTNAGGTPGDCWFAIDASGKLYGFESGAELGTLTSSLSLTGEINMATGAITLASVPGSSDSISISGTIGADGTINSGTWRGKRSSGTFSGSKLQLE